MKLILLWFASWKTATWTTLPSWVKTNTKRFQTLKRKNGKDVWTFPHTARLTWKLTKRLLSPFAKHLKAKDGAARTVICRANRK